MLSEPTMTTPDLGREGILGRESSGAGADLGARWAGLAAGIFLDGGLRGMGTPQTPAGVRGENEGVL